MESDLLKIILQIDTLIDAAKGLPNNPVPDGVNPAPEGSTFDTKHIPPLLSTNEKSRVKEIAKIFKEIFTPKAEAERVSVPVTKDREVSQNIKLSLDGKKLGKDKGSVIESLLGSTAGAIGEAGGILGAIKFAILGLAGALGVSVLTLAGGKAFQWIVEGLKAAQGIDWTGIDQLAKTMTTVIKDVVGVIKDLISFLVGLGIDIASKWASGIKNGIEFAVDMIGKFGDTLKKYRDVQWEDLKKASVAISFFMGTLMMMGIPPIALFEAIGNIIFTWSNLNINLFSKNLELLSIGLDKLFITLKTYKDLDFVGFANALKASFGIIGGLAGISFVAPLAALGAFTAEVAALGLDSVASTMGNLSIGIEKLGKAQVIFAEGVRTLQDLDPKKLFDLSSGLSELSKSMVSFGVGSIFSSFFKSDELKGIVKLADSHTKLHSAASAIENISSAFKMWSNLPLDMLSYNLEQIQKTTDKLDIKKLEKAINTTLLLKTQQDEYTKATYTYIVSGKDNRDGGNGLLSLTRDILNEHKKLNTTVIKIKDTLLKIENMPQQPQPASQTNMLYPFDGRKTTQTNPRDGIRPLGLE